MGREVRMVPADWVHPKDGGKYRPLHEHSYTVAAAEWEAGLALWLDGKRDNYQGGTEEHGERSDVYGWSAWAGDRPRPEKYMPDWPAEQRTHFMMYENTSEGTPISPAFATAEELARWLADTKASSFGSMTATYEQWLATIRGGFAPSMVLDSKGLRSGVDASPDHQG